MVFEPNYTRVVSSSRKNIGITQSVIELKLPTNEDVIDKVYSISAKSTIVSSEVAGNDINFVGLVDFQTIFESAGITAFDYSAEFKDRYTCESEVLGEVLLTSNVVDVTSNIVSNGIKVVAIVETTIDQIVSSDVNVLTNINSENANISTKEIEFNTYIGKAYEKFDINQDFDVKNATKILMVTPSACVSSVTPNENFVTVSGVLNVDICYQTGENNGDVASEEQAFDFSWDVALSGIEDTSYVQSELSVMFNEIKVTTLIEENGANVSLYVPMSYTGYVFNKTSLNIIDDVYIKENYLSITSEGFNSLYEISSTQFRDSISGTAEVLESSPFIDEILGVCTNNIVLASSNVDNGRLSIEGVANVTVVYYTKETNALTSVQVEMPFSIEQKVDGDVASVVTLCLSDVNARSKRGKEIEVSANLNVYVDMYSISSLQVISNVSLGDEKPKDDCSLYIYIVKEGDTIWDIAKEMNVGEEMILEQNPDIELPLKAGEKLIIYNPSLLGF